MDWNGLKTFSAVVAAGSLSGAAKTLGVNHSTVYRRIQALEDELQARLLEVQGNRHVLTPLGEELANHAGEIETRFHDIERLLIGKEVQPKGVVRITAPYNLANRVIPKALAPFRQLYPEILVETFSSNIEFNLNSRMADIALRATQSPPEYLIGKKVASLPWGVCASVAYMAASAPLKRMEDLANQRLISGSGHMRGLPAFSWIEKHFPQQIHTRCDELTAMAHFAAADHGVAILPLDQLHAGIRWVMDFPMVPASDLWLLTHPDLRHTERVRLVIQHLTDYFRTVDFTPAVAISED